MKTTSLIFLFFLSLPFNAYSQSPNLKLAAIYQQGINLNDYLMSEKYDGVRAYWDGQQLVSRQGNIFAAPDWFIKDLGTTPLDGELWIARQHFDELSGIVRQKSGTHQGWHKIQYRVFDLPHHQGIFSERYRALITLTESNLSPYLKLVIQKSIKDHDTLMRQLKIMVEQGAEGIMLQRKDAPYQAKRSHDLIKVKLWEDAEARVIAHYPGKGKYEHVMGSILVENASGIQFRLGSGFNDQQRASPPAIGTIVTYKYYGSSPSGKPRFASFLRIRETIKTQ
ncbi:MAG: DNA ligase [Desulfocapsa sp.]|nr:MAG: DNA ligase [Desulfocapsa sp.]